MQTSLVKEIVSPVGGTDGLEAAMVAQLGAFYTPLTFQAYDISNHPNLASTCIIGNYIDTEAGLPTPFLAVNTAGEGVANATWVVTGFRAIMDMGVNPAGMKEQAGLFGIAEIPTTTVNWDSHWVVCGHVWDSSAPANMTPIIITAKANGNTSIMSSQIGGILPPLSWELTSFGGVDDRKPTMLCDLVYDAQNDALVAVGNCVETASPISSFSIFVEMTKEGNPPTYTYNLNYGLSFDVDYPAFLRSAAIQTQDVGGATVANRTIVTAVGFKDSTNYGTWCIYQPNFSNPWGGGNPRWAWIERGINLPADFYTQQGLATNDTPTYLTFCKRVTADGEDIYFICGIAPDGMFTYAVSGLETDSTGGGYDNIIAQAGVSTGLRFLECVNEINFFRSNPQNVVVAPTTLATSTITDVIALSDRQTKLYATGYDENGRNASLDATGFGGKYALIMAVSRGVKIASTEVTISGLEKGLFQNTAVRLKLAPLNQSTITKIAYANASYRPTGFGQPSSLVEFSAATGHAAYAWFEYLLYDGVDSLIARKLNEMGVRVTIANVEWYKQDILKKKMDVSTDFFNEWAELQLTETKERERVAEQFGVKRPKKRAVRTELFDDYADWEEKENQVKAFPDYDPNNDGDPFKDDVALEQEVGKTQKAVDDLRRIEDVIQEDKTDEAEYDDAADVSDWGED